MFCRYCGQQMSDEARFCPACGRQVDTYEAANGAASDEGRPSGQNRRTWILILAGALGIVLILSVILTVLALNAPERKAQKDTGGKAVAAQTKEPEEETKKETKEETKEEPAAFGETDAYKQMMDIFEEGYHAAIAWGEKVGDYSDPAAAAKATAELYDTLADELKRTGAIEGLPENVRGAVDDYYEITMSAEEGLYNNLQFQADLKKLDQDIDRNDLTGTYDRFTADYKAVKCPANLTDPWSRIGKSVDHLEIYLKRSQMGDKLGDNFRYFTAQSHLRRFVLMMCNEIDIVDDILVSERQFVSLQFKKADVIYRELSDMSQMTTEEAEKYRFAYDVKNVLSEPTYDHIETIYPSLYNSYESFVTVKLGCFQGERDVIVQCEIPGLSQSVSQSYHIGPVLSVINIKPPALDEKLNLDNAKDSQIKVSIKDKKDGSLIDEQSFPVHITSRNDFKWSSDEYGTITKDNILCFLAPDSEAIAELKRNAVDILSEMTGGEMSAIVGYQGPYFLRDDNGDGKADNVESAKWVTTFLQAAALMRAMSDMGVRYSADTFSIDNSGQHILFPDQVLERKSGVCIETALVIASALQSAGMNTYIIMPPGHAQVAVETWDGSANYLLIETTALPNTNSQFIDEANDVLNGTGCDNEPITMYDRTDWGNYIFGDEDTADDDCYIIDCSDGAVMGLTPFAY